MRRLVTSSEALYSRPSRSSSRITPDLGADGDEIRRGVERQDAAVAEGEPCQQVEGDRGEPEAFGEPAGEAEGEDDRAQFDEEGGRVVHGHSPPMIASSASTPSRVPTTTSVSPMASRKSGPGDGWALVRRRTATTEAPVRVRARVSPSRRPRTGSGW